MQKHASARECRNTRNIYHAQFDRQKHILSKLASGTLSLAHTFGGVVSIAKTSSLSGKPIGMPVRNLMALVFTLSSKVVNGL